MMGKSLNTKKALKEIRKMDMKSLRKVKKMVISYKEADEKPYVYKGVYIRLFGRIFVLHNYMTNKPKKALFRGIYNYSFEYLLEICCDGAIFGYTTEILDKRGRSVLG
jgi:hypothetical protein